MNIDKTGHQLTLFPLQPSTSDDAITEMGQCKKNGILFLKIRMSLKI